MGRYISGTSTTTTAVPDDTGGATPVTDTTAFSTLVAGEDLAAGDIVAVNYNNDRAYWCQHPDTVGYEDRPLYNETATWYEDVSDNVTIDIGNTGVTTSSYNIQDGNFVSTVLSNGSLAIFYKLASNNYPVLLIYDKTGSLVTAPIAVNSASSTGGNLAIAALTGGGCVVAFTNANSTNGGTSPMYAVYSNAGAVVQTASVIETANGVRSLAVTGLVAGGFVVAWYKTVSTSKQPYFARYNASGAIQGIITQVDNTNTSLSSVARRNGPNLGVASITNGHFVVLYNVTTTTDSSVWFARYNASGVLQGNRALVYTTAVGDLDIPVDICTLTDSSYAVAVGVYATTLNASAIHQKFNSSGEGVGEGEEISDINNPAEVHQFGLCKVTSTGSGTYAAILANSSGTNPGAIVSKVDDKGQVTKIGLIEDALSPVSAAYDSATQRLYMSAGKADPGGENSGLIVYVGLLAKNTIADFENTLTLTTGQFVSGTFLNIMPDATDSTVNNIAVGVSEFAGTTILNIMGPGLPKLTLAGVAMTATLAGNNAKILIKGTITLRLTADTPYSVDTRSQTPPGQKMSVIGNTATLEGVQST